MNSTEVINTEGLFSKTKEQDEAELPAKVEETNMPELKKKAVAKKAKAAKKVVKKKAPAKKKAVAKKAKAAPASAAH